MVGCNARHFGTGEAAFCEVCEWSRLPRDLCIHLKANYVSICLWFAITWKSIRDIGWRFNIIPRYFTTKTVRARVSRFHDWVWYQLIQLINGCCLNPWIMSEGMFEKVGCSADVMVNLGPLCRLKNNFKMQSLKTNYKSLDVEYHTSLLRVVLQAGEILVPEFQRESSIWIA